MTSPYTVEEYYRCILPMITRVTPLLDLSQQAPEYMYQGSLGVNYDEKDLSDELIAAEMHFKMMEESAPAQAPEYMYQGSLGVNEDDDQLTAWELHFKYLEEQQQVEEETQRLLAIEKSLGN